MTFEYSPEELAARDAGRALAHDHLTAAVSVDEQGVVPANVLTAATALLDQHAGARAAALVVEEIAVASPAVAAAVIGQAGESTLPGLRGAARLTGDAIPARTRVLVGALGVGIGRAALDYVIADLRAAGDRPGGAPDERPHWLLSEAATEIDAARLLVGQAAHGLETGKGTDASAASAQAFAITAADRAVDIAIRLAGADAYTRGSLLERLSRDVRALAVFAGSEDDQRLVAAGEMPV